MPNLVNLENVSKAYGTTTVLTSVSLGIGTGERIGVVGRNGDGKTTLARLITGAETPDAGRVALTGGTRIGYVTQSGDLPASSVRTVVVGDGAEHEWAGDAAIRTVLSGLGLAAVGLDAPVDRLSGGERRRVALAAALVQPADLLVLDEPTNHLDVEGVTWLASYLVQRRSALLAITHDRWFLDAACLRTWEVVAEGVQQYDGGYAAYVLARAERARQASTAEARRQNLLRKELAWLRRGPPARTSKPRFRIEAAEALIAAEPPARSAVSLQAMARRRLGRTVFSLSEVSVTVGARVLLKDVTWQVGPGDRIGVIGVNGSGKTHLLRLLAGTLAPSSGTVEIGQTVRSAYLSQEVTELPGSLRVVEAVQDVASSAVLGGVEMSAGQLAERFGFAGSSQWTPVGELSGGERRRLQLLRLLLTEPNVLLLDEPTNDLDTDTLAALEDLLDSWAGTLVVVSHDRYLLERVCDSTVALIDGAVLALPGGVDEYLARRAAASATPAPTRGSRGDTRASRRELTRLEREVARLEKREAALHAELATYATDFERVSALDAELRAVVEQRRAAEEEWLNLSDT